MNISKFRNCGILFSKFQQSLSIINTVHNAKNLISGKQSAFFSYLCNPFRSLENKLPQAPLSNVSFRGLKTRGHLQLRCKDCYFARKDGLVYVLCNSHPRHKQVRLTRRTKYTWILTYAFQTKKRPY